MIGSSALLFALGEAAGDVEAKDAADALGLNARARLSRDSPPADEGGTARIVDRSRGLSSSSTSRPFSNSVNSGGGDVGGVLPWENLKDEGVYDDATRVSASDALVDADCLAFFFRAICKGAGGWSTRVLLASNFAMVLATWLPLETRDVGLSNP